MRRVVEMGINNGLATVAGYPDPAMTPLGSRRVFPWHPRLMPSRGLQFEFIGDHILGADAANIGVWPDNSLARNHAFYVNSGQPIKKTAILNGHDIGRFSGSLLRIEGRFIPVPVSVSFFAVIKGSTGGTIVSGEQGTFQCRIGSSKINILRAAEADIGSSTTSLSSSTWYTIGVTHDPSLGSNKSKFYLNGSPDGTANTAGNFTTQVRYVGQSRFNTEDFNGDIAYISLYNRVVDDFENTLIHLRLRELFATW